MLANSTLYIEFPHPFSRSWKTSPPVSWQPLTMLRVVEGPPPSPSSEACIREIIRDELHLLLFVGSQEKSNALGEMRLLFNDVRHEKSLVEERRSQGIKRISSVREVFQVLQGVVECAKPVCAEGSRIIAATSLSSATMRVASLFGMKRSAVAPAAAETSVGPAEEGTSDISHEFTCVQQARSCFVDAKKEVERLVWKGEPFHQLDEKVTLREEARKAYTVAISFAMERVLRMTGSADKNSLSSHIANTRRAFDDLLKRTEAAEALLTKFSDVTAIEVPVEGKGPGAWDAVGNAWRCYRERCDMKSKEIVEVTEDSIKSISKVASMKLKLLFLVEPSELQTRFEWSHSVASSKVDQLELIKQLKEACQRLAQEKDFWDSFDAVKELPMNAILRFAQEECERRKLYLESLVDAQVVYEVLEDEHRQQSECFTDEADRRKKKVIDVFQGKAEQRHRSIIDVDLAALQLKKEQIGSINPKLATYEKKLVDTKEKAKRASSELEDAMRELFRLAKSFPEVIVRIKSEKCLDSAIPPELRPLWKGMRTLEEFETCQELSTDSRHTVYKVLEGGEHFACKAYSLGDVASKSSCRDVFRRCLREASLLFRLQHPNIVKISSIFASLGGLLCIQMPYYANSSLDVWVRAKHPTQGMLLKACGQALLALNHCHVMRVVHADVKPGNILIDTFNNAFLADFDISVDTKTRYSSASMTKLVGGTANFLAPEIERGGEGASAKSDMFAYGRTLLAVEALEVKHELVSRLLHDDPSKRPTAEVVLAHATFREALCSVEADTCQCSGGCMDYKNSSHGVVCPVSHFVCQDCLGPWVRAELDLITASADYLTKHRQRNGLVVCPQCKSMDVNEGLLDDQAVATWLDATTCRQYRAARDASTEQRIFEETKAEFDRQVAALEAKYAKLNSERLRRQQEIANEAATREFLRRNFPGARQCPRCGYGPVINENCWNLRTHEGDRVRGGGRISNSCPSCNFFDADWNRWVPWVA